jgi:hypothetical protein
MAFRDNGACFCTKRTTTPLCHRQRRRFHSRAIDFRMTSSATGVAVPPFSAEPAHSQGDAGRTGSAALHQHLKHRATSCCRIRFIARRAWPREDPRGPMPLCGPAEDSVRVTLSFERAHAALDVDEVSCASKVVFLVAPLRTFENGRSAR